MIPRCNWGKMTSDLKQKDFPEAFLSGIGYGTAIVIGLSLGMCTGGEIEVKPSIIYQTQYESIEERQALNQENVLYWLNYFEVEHQEIVLAQSIQECGWKYDSYRAQELNNIFGFQTSETNVLSFGHWIGSIIYYKKWQQTYYEGGDYLEFLNEYKYAADPNYCLKLKKIIQIIEAE